MQFLKQLSLIVFSMIISLLLLWRTHPVNPYPGMPDLMEREVRLEKTVKFFDQVSIFEEL